MALCLTGCRKGIMLNWLQKDYVKLAVEMRLCLTGCRKRIMLNWLQKGDYFKLAEEKGLC